MLVPFLIVVVFVVDGVVKGETVNVAVNACSDDLSVIVGNSNVLDVVRKGEELYYGRSTLRVS